MGENRNMPLREPVDRHATDHRRPVAALPLQTANRRHPAAHRSGRHSAAKWQRTGRHRPGPAAEGRGRCHRNRPARHPFPLCKCRLDPHLLGSRRTVCHPTGPRRPERFAHRAALAPAPGWRHCPRHRGRVDRHHRYRQRPARLAHLGRRDRLVADTLRHADAAHHPAARRLD